MELYTKDGKGLEVLKGTKTEQNLNTALAGESMAYLRYKWYEQHATMQGVREGAQIFAETADNEKEHAEIWFRYLGGWGDTEENLLGILNACWPGRFEVLGINPMRIADGAHNADTAKRLAETIENCFTNQQLTYIIGVLADKEHQEMLQQMLPYAKQVYTITPPNTRALDGQILVEEVSSLKPVSVEYCESIREALHKALAYGREHDTPILAFGSLSYLGELREAYKQEV